jgi:hypothetical protein
METQGGCGERPGCSRFQQGASSHDVDFGLALIRDNPVYENIPYGRIPRNSNWHYMGPYDRCLGPEVSEPQIWQDPVPPVNHKLIAASDQA